MQCTYNFDTRRLTVFSPVDVDTTQLSIAFSVDSFKNPYNGRPKSGFFVLIQDSFGGNIDSSWIAGILMSIQMKQWASFVQASVTRDDDITTVGERSIGNIFFSLDFPVDQNCRVTIGFPPDMPLTSDLQKVISTGIINQKFENL